MIQARFRSSNVAVGRWLVEGNTCIVDMSVSRADIMTFPQFIASNRIFWTGVMWVFRDERHLSYQKTSQTFSSSRSVANMTTCTKYPLEVMHCGKVIISSLFCTVGISPGHVWHFMCISSSVRESRNNETIEVVGVTSQSPSLWYIPCLKGHEPSNNTESK